MRVRKNKSEKPASGSTGPWVVPAWHVAGQSNPLAFFGGAFATQTSHPTLLAGLGPKRNVYAKRNGSKGNRVLGRNFQERAVIESLHRKKVHDSILRVLLLSLGNFSFSFQ